MCMITLTFELLKGGGLALISNAESGLLILTTVIYTCRFKTLDNKPIEFQ